MGCRSDEELESKELQWWIADLTGEKWEKNNIYIQIMFWFWLLICFFLFAKNLKKIIIKMRSRHSGEKEENKRI